MKRGKPLRRRKPLRARSPKKKARGSLEGAVLHLEGREIAMRSMWPPVEGRQYTPVESTTERSPAAPQPKPVRFQCRALLDFHKRQRCEAGDPWTQKLGVCAGPIDPHHFPTRGAGGDDLGVIPICRKHHDDAQAYRFPFTREWQEAAAARALLRFFHRANAGERGLFIAAWEAYASGRVFEVNF